MDTITFSSLEELVSHLGQHYLADKYSMSIQVEHDFGISPNGALKIARINTLKIYNSELRKESTSLIKPQVVVKEIRLTNKLYNKLEGKLEIKTQFYMDAVADFCHELTPLKRKLQNLLAYLNEPDAVDIANSTAEAS